MDNPASRVPTRRHQLLALFLAGLAAGLGAGCNPKAAANRPRSLEPGGLASTNLLLITLDTTRADYLGCYGDKQARTPTIDRLAAEGSLFEQAVSPVPLTLPAHTSIMSGLNPPQHGLHGNGAGAVGPDVPLLADMLRSKGYSTAAFVAAFVLDKQFGLSRGFDLYDDRIPQGNRPNVLRQLEAQRRASEMNAVATPWLESAKEPFFGWVHYYDPHAPFDAPGFPGVRSPYAAEITYVDEQIGYLIDILERRKLRERTLVVVVADHGESLGEHGEDGHGFFVYNSVLHVPMIVSMPGVTRAGSRVSELVGLVDILPTLAELYGLPTSTSWSGRSLAPAMRGEKLPDAAYYGECDGPLDGFGCAVLYSLMRGPWHFILAVRPELYNRATDPGELTNLAEKEPEVFDRMADELARLRETIGDAEPQPVVLDDAARQKLAALGYLAPSQAGDGSPAPPCDPKDTVGAVRLMTEAEARVARGDLKGAIEAAEQVLVLAPRATTARWMLTSLYLRSEEWSKADQQLEAILALRPKSTNAWMQRGEISLRTNDADAARRCFEAALTVDPTFAPARQRLAEISRSPSP